MELKSGSIYKIKGKGDMLYLCDMQRLGRLNKRRGTQTFGAQYEFQQESTSANYHIFIPLNCHVIRFLAENKINTIFGLMTCMTYVVSTIFADNALNNAQHKFALGTLSKLDLVSSGMYIVADTKLPRCECVSRGLEADTLTKDYYKIYLEFYNFCISKWFTSEKLSKNRIDMDNMLRTFIETINLVDSNEHERVRMFKVNQIHKALQAYQIY